MQWFRGRRGLDLNFAKKQQWWSDVNQFIETDEKTQLKIVDYIFQVVSKGKLEELDFVIKQFTDGQNGDDVLNVTEMRKQIIQHLLENSSETKQ